MMLHAWNGYVKFAWGHNELAPISERGHSSSIFGNTRIGVTIVDALDTLYLMDLMEEFKKGRQWITENLNFDDINEYVSVFEVNIRFVAGLLSCFALTNDSMFLQKAEHIAAKLLPAFDTATGLPKSRVNLNSKPTTINMLDHSPITNLAEVGTLHLEFVYLSDATRNQIYRRKVENIRRLIHRITPNSGLYTNTINTSIGQLAPHDVVSLGAGGDSFYEYLLKSWIQSNKEDKRAKVMFFRTMRAVRIALLKRSKNGLYYLGDYSSYTRNQMSHLSCFSGGMFALMALFTSGNKSEEFRFIATELTKTCRESYRRSATGLGPEEFGFTDEVEAEALLNRNKEYFLRPEVVESYFYLWRLTGDEKYRDWAWDAVIALQKYCRVNNGFSGILDVYNINSAKDDVQQSFFLAETLKYLYLTFSDDLIPLDKWVFNTEGHPLPIKGKSVMYPATSSSHDLSN